MSWNLVLFLALKSKKGLLVSLLSYVEDNKRGTHLVIIWNGISLKSWNDFDSVFDSVVTVTVFGLTTYNPEMVLEFGLRFRFYRHEILSLSVPSQILTVPVWFLKRLGSLVIHLFFKTWLTQIKTNWTMFRQQSKGLTMKIFVEWLFEVAEAVCEVTQPQVIDRKSE